MSASFVSSDLIMVGREVDEGFIRLVEDTHSGQVRRVGLLLSVVVLAGFFLRKIRQTLVNAFAPQAIPPGRLPYVSLYFRLYHFLMYCLMGYS
jgi:hypothetical protein